MCANCEDENGCGKTSSSENEGFTCSDVYKTTISQDRKCDGRPSCTNSKTTVTLSHNKTRSVYNYEDEYGCHKNNLTGDYMDSCTVTSIR